MEPYRSKENFFNKQSKNGVEFYVIIFSDLKLHPVLQKKNYYLSHESQGEEIGWWCHMAPKQQGLAKRQQGLTVIELLVLLLVIGILAVIVLPHL